VVIYRRPILRIARTRGEVIQQVQETVLHELGHHFGLDEEDLPF
jgi:predicted Zn-dependent protease with MMP-like domain